MKVPQNLKRYTIDILERSSGQTSIMAESREFKMKYRSVDCHIEPVSSKERVFRRQESEDVEYRLYADRHPSMSLQISDVVLWNDARYKIESIQRWPDVYILDLSTYG